MSNLTEARRSLLHAIQRLREQRVAARAHGLNAAIERVRAQYQANARGYEEEVQRQRRELFAAEGLRLNGQLGLKTL